MNGWEFYRKNQTIRCGPSFADGMCSGYYDYFTKANIILAVTWQQAPADNGAEQTINKLDSLLLAKFDIA